MKSTDWREVVEIVAAVSIVAALLLIAWEVRQSNRIAAATVELELASAALWQQRLSDPALAQLFAKLEAPDEHLITATDTSRIDALARAICDRYASVQLAYDRGIIGEPAYAAYRDEFVDLNRRWPGLNAALDDTRRSNARYRQADILQSPGAGDDDP